MPRHLLVSIQWLFKMQFKMHFVLKRTEKDGIQEGKERRKEGGGGKGEGGGRREKHLRGSCEKSKMM
jgi:hypothetical protein